MQQLFKIQGYINNDNPSIEVNNIPLNPKDVKKFDPKSQSDFSWGYYGEGPRTLATAILMKFIPEKHWTNMDNLPQRFAERFINGWGDGAFNVKIDIVRWLRNQDYKHEIVFYHFISEEQ